LYLQYGYYTNVSDIYSKQDSLYSLALERARERLSAGETDGIEVMEARAQLTHVKKMKMESLSELKGLTAMFRLWIGGEGVPDVSSINQQQWSSANEEVVIKEHPLLKRLDDGIKLAQMEGSWKRAQLNPLWTLALSNTSFRGTGADDKKYDATSRFTSLQLGIGLPVFGRQGKKLDEIARMTTQKAELEKTMTEARLKTMLTIQKERWNSIQLQYADFEKESLPLASQLLTIARNKLESGEIDFMKYAYMTGQAYSLLLDYVSLKKQLDEAGLDYYFVN
jgi:cobalt-zinc-cadmium resistance protein CzcA